MEQKRSLVQPSDARARKGDEIPLAEGISKLRLSPIYVQINEPSANEQLFAMFRIELESSGYKTPSDLQCEPHERYRLLDFYEVRKASEGKREDESIGMVSLYAEGDVPKLIKISLEESASLEGMLSLLGNALSSVVRAKAGTNLDIHVSEGEEPK